MDGLLQLRLGLNGTDIGLQRERERERENKKKTYHNLGYESGLFLANRVLDHIQTLHGGQTGHEVGACFSGVEGGGSGSAPDSPALILVIPTEMLNDKVLSAILLLGGNNAGLSFLPVALDASGGCSLPACDADDELADAGFGDIGDGSCAV